MINNNGIFPQDITLSGATSLVLNSVTIVGDTTYNKQTQAMTVNWEAVVNELSPVNLPIQAGNNLNVFASRAQGQIDAITSGTSAVTGVNTFTGAILIEGVANKTAVTSIANVITVSLADNIEITSAKLSSLTPNTVLYAGTDGAISSSTTMLAELETLNGINTTTGIQDQLNARLIAANNLSDLTSVSTARSNLGLGSAALLNSGVSTNNVVQYSANNIIGDGDTYFNGTANTTNNINVSTENADNFEYGVVFAETTGTKQPKIDRANFSYNPFTKILTAQILESKSFVGTSSFVLLNDGNGKIIQSGTSDVKIGYINNLTSDAQAQLDGKEPTITAGTTAQYWRGDKSWQTLDTSVVPENTNLYYTDARARAAISGTGSLLDYNSTTGVLSTNYTAENTANKGIVNGYASLDSNGYVPLSQTNPVLIGSLNYQGTWNASTNTPTLTSSVGIKGYYYVVSVAGTTTLNGISAWNIGDWAVFDGLVWEKVDNAVIVSSVNGQTGTVVLTTSNINEGTNLYYTNARVYSAISASVPLTYNPSTGLFGITQATTSTNGYLTSTDWNTFNSKQNVFAGLTTQYVRGDASLATLNQAAVAGLTTGDTPIFQGLKLTSLTASRVIVTDSSNFLIPSATTSTQVGYLSIATGSTGTGKIVFDTSPVLGAFTATSINGLTITSSTGTLTITSGKLISFSSDFAFNNGGVAGIPTLQIAGGKTVIINNTLTFTGSDTATLNIGSGVSLTTLTTSTLGDMIYSSGVNTLAKLAGNTTSTKNFLTQTGTGTVSAAPAWSTITQNDVAGLTTSSTPTFVGVNKVTITAPATSSTLTIANSGTLGLGSLTLANNSSEVTYYSYYLSAGGNIRRVSGLGINQDGTTTPYYTKLATVQANDSHVVLSGFLGGQSVGQGTCALNIAITSRNGTIALTGTALGTLFSGDILIYIDGSNNLTVWLKTVQFAECSLDISFAGSLSNNNQVTIVTPTTTAPSGTLAYTLSTRTGTGATLNDTILTSDGNANLNSLGNIAINTATNGYQYKGVAVSAGTANGYAVTGVVLSSGTVTINNNICVAGMGGYAFRTSSSGTPSTGYNVTCGSGTFTVTGTSLDNSTLSVIFVKIN